jgi:hypothetical protein
MQNFIKHLPALALTILNLLAEKTHEESIETIKI